MRGVVPAERHRAAQRHAERPWTCECGKICWGNGGKSSHKRACIVYMTSMIAWHKATAARTRVGEIERHLAIAEQLEAEIARRSQRQGRKG